MTAMDDNELIQIKAQLDAALRGRRPRVALGFGHELYSGFLRMGWIKLKNFGLEGSGFRDPYPVYDDTHIITVFTDVPGKGFRVGEDVSGTSTNG